MVRGNPKTVALRERARGALRALYLGELADIGDRRRAALADADRQLDKLAHLVLNASDAGISVSEIARMAHVSRPTVYALLPRARDKPRDVRMAVLQATVDASTPAQISKRADWPEDEVVGLLESFAKRAWVEQSEDGSTWAITAQGVEAIESWDWIKSMDDYPAYPDE